MNRLLILLCFGIAACAPEKKPEPELPPFPETPVRMVSEVMYGQEINDPYRYLEDLKNPDVERWYRENGERSRLVIDAISGRKELIEKMKEFDNRNTTRVFSLDITETNRYFYQKQTPADETGKLFYRDGFNGNESLLFDPEQYDPTSKQKYVISSMYPSFDGNKIAIEVSPNGSESSTLLIMDVTTGKMYPEKIDRCWFASCSWLPDGNSFLFNRLNSADVLDRDREKNSKVFLHKVGTDPSGDKEILSRATNPDLDIKEEEIPAIMYDRHSKTMIAFSYSVDRRLKAWSAPATDLSGTIRWKQLFSPNDMIYDFAITEKDVYALTPKDAPNFKVIRTSLSKPDFSKAEVIVPEFKDRNITQFALNSEGLYVSTTKNGVEASVYRIPMAGGPMKEIKLPVQAGNAGISTRGYRFPEVWISAGGWTQSNKRYRYNPIDEQFTVEMLSTQAEYPEYADLVVEEVMIKSHDGVEVPLSLIYNKNTKRDGTNPVFLFGYGAYGYSISPFFSPIFMMWTLKGGIIAAAHVRGGGELGEKWHRAGQKTTKPNTWKDLIASAEYLVSNQYTSPGKIAINGGSAGGILIGRAMTERPDLFGVAIPEVGCLNPLRAEESPNGPINVPEFGTIKDSIEFLALREMDSYHHVKDGTKYPATLITAGMNDPRVIAWEPGKFAARLQAANASGKPVLFLADFEAGHGIGDTKTKQFESHADMVTFALWQIGHPEFQISTLPVYKTEKPEKQIQQ